MGGQETLILQKDLKKMEEKLATAERERDWAMTALRQSESELQKVLTQWGTGDADVSNVRLNHYRVLLELLNLRCRLLEQWIEKEASLMATQEEGHAEALRRMEQQVQELATEVVEQQSAFQEKLEQQHCEDYSLWSEELLRGREKASEEIAALREDLKRQECLWHQEWVKMQQEACLQGINVPDPPGFLLQWIASEEGADLLKESENDRGRAAPLETIPEAATETEAVHASLDRMQELLNQDKENIAKQLQWLRADFEELEILRAEELNGGGGDTLDDSSSEERSQNILAEKDVHQLVEELCESRNEVARLESEMTRLVEERDASIQSSRS